MWWRWRSGPQTGGRSSEREREKETAAHVNTASHNVLIYSCSSASNIPLSHTHERVWTISHLNSPSHTCTSHPSSLSQEARLSTLRQMEFRFKPDSEFPALRPPNHWQRGSRRMQREETWIPRFSDAVDGDLKRHHSYRDSKVFSARLENPKQSLFLEFESGTRQRQ